MSEPRYLTEDEINYILADFPKVHGVDVDITESVRSSLMKKLRKMLMEIKITPLGIDELKERIKEEFEKAKISPGSKVGFSAVSSIGQLTTQLALNSFHSSGLNKNITTGVARLRELLELKSNPRNPSCTIFFKQPTTFEQIVFHYRPLFSEVTVADLTRDYGILKVDEIAEVNEWWYDKVENSSNILFRLYLNVYQMVAHKVTIYNIVEAIENHKPQTVKAVYSPTPIGIIDLYPIESVIVTELGKKFDINKINTSYDMLINAFFSSVFANNLDKIIVKGIPGIKNIYPASINIESAIYDTIDMDNVYRIILNEKLMKTTPITKQMIKDVIGGLIKNEGDDYIDIAKPYDISTIKQQTHPIYYAETNGSNLLGLLSRPEVDGRYTTTNNVNEIFNLYGIEAVRNFLIKEYILNLLSEGNSPIDPRHIVMIAEFQTNQGRLNPATYTGIQRQPTGALTKATFERPMDIFLEEAAYGKRDLINTISASIMTGKKPEIGTGIVNLQVDEDAMKEIDKMKIVDPIMLDSAIKSLDISPIPIKNFTTIFKPSIKTKPRENIQPKITSDIVETTTIVSELTQQALYEILQVKCSNRRKPKPPDLKEVMKFIEDNFE
jgi:DNA-directed RNA polymerase beta' subunit